MLITKQSDAVTSTADSVTSNTDSATSEAEMSTLGTQNKEKQIKTNQNKLNHLSDSPQGENGGGKILEKKEGDDTGRHRQPATTVRRHAA